MKDAEQHLYEGMYIVSATLSEEARNKALDRIQSGITERGGEMVKVHTLKDAKILESKFLQLAKQFDITLKVLIHRTDEPCGRGIGPVLETREAIRVLQQKENKPLDLEVRALHLAGTLLDLCLKDSPKTQQDFIKKAYGNGTGWATYLLQKGDAFKKMQEIIKAQKGNPDIDSEDLKPGKYSHQVRTPKKGKVKKILSKNATIICKVLGAPAHKGAGIFLHKKIGETFDKNELLYTLYSESNYNLKEAVDSLENFPITES